MAQAAWGLKRLCQNCYTRFYDLNKPNIICPECETPLTKHQYVRPKKKDLAAAKAALDLGTDDIVLIDDEIEVELDEELEEEELDEDDSPLSSIKPSKSKLDI